jgi:hypothetical protein
MGRRKDKRVQMNLTIEKELRDWLYSYSKSRRKRVTGLIEGYIKDLRERESKRTNILGESSIPSSIRED